MKADLHNHSTYSDGIYSVRELISIAKEKGADVIALTDHDSVYGLKEAMSIGIQNGIKVIPGIELSTIHNEESVHIIGLFKNNYVPDDMYKFSDEMKKIRRQRCIDMMNKISTIYHLNINLDDLLDRDVITRGNMFQSLMKSNPLVSKEEINFYLSHESKAYIEVAHFDTLKGIKFLKKNNCITIYAHPCLNSRKTNLEVIKMKVDGIEYKYPKNKEDDEEFYLSLAKKNKLLLSAGSDFHGDINHSDMLTSTLDYKDYLKILERLGE
ncbi:MAG: PHP domain-containing protein [Anaeroplasmataceae bacterium]